MERQSTMGLRVGLRFLLILGPAILLSLSLFLCDTRRAIAQASPIVRPMKIRTRQIDDRSIREISFGDGWFELSPKNTLGRYYRTRGLEGLYQDLQWRPDNRNTLRNNVNHWKVYLAIAKQIKTEWREKNGTRHTTTVTIDGAEVRRCVRAYQMFADLVMTYTRGAMVIESRIETLQAPISKIYTVRPGQYWIPPHNIVSQKAIRSFKPHSIILYCRPGDIPISNSLLGATHGSDRGILGAGTSTIHIPERFFGTPDGLPDNIVTILTLREFLHQLNFSARALMGYNNLPSLRAAPELGYELNDLEIPLWTAALRDLMMNTYPASFWRSARMGILRSENTRKPPPWIQNRLCAYDEVIGEWPTQLPHLHSHELEQITGVKGIEPIVGQFEAGKACYLFLRLPDSIATKDTLRIPIQGDTSLNNQLSLDPESGLESMAVLRVPGKMDLVVVRMDVAKPVLEALRTDLERPANRCVLGYISGLDPIEGNPISFLVAQTDFGEELPKDELEAISRGVPIEEIKPDIDEKKEETTEPN